MSIRVVLVALVVLALIGTMEVSATYATDTNFFNQYVDYYKNTLDFIGIVSNSNSSDGYINALENVLKQNNNVKESAAHIENNVLYIDITAYDGSREAGRDLITLAFAGFAQAVKQIGVDAVVFTRIDDFMKKASTVVCTFHANKALAQDALINQNDSTKIKIDLLKFADTCQCKAYPPGSYPENTNEMPTLTGNCVGNTDTKVYHNPSCTWATKILPENLIGFSSPQEANENGYRPCEKCNPSTD